MENKPIDKERLLLNLRASSFWLPPEAAFYIEALLEENDALKAELSTERRQAEQAVIEAAKEFVDAEIDYGNHLNLCTACKFRGINFCEAGGNATRQILMIACVSMQRLLGKLTELEAQDV